MKNIISNYVSLIHTLRSTGAAKLEFEASGISEVELREVNSTGPNVKFTVDDVELTISKVTTNTEKPKIDKRNIHLKTPKRSKRSKMEKKTIKNTTVKFASRKRAKKGQKNCAEKRQKHAKKKPTILKTENKPKKGRPFEHKWVKNRMQRPKQVQHETGPWSIDSRQLCLDTFMEYCNSSSGERYKKIYEILGGERTMSKFCLAIFYEYYLQI